uniref:Uncharacterized protein n=1 Tax=Lepeophtheirus salmonis TaxID=72036 RepID=A0A0K2UGQ2_LEPSM
MKKEKLLLLTHINILLNQESRTVNRKLLLFQNIFGRILRRFLEFTYSKLFKSGT